MIGGPSTIIFESYLNKNRRSQQKLVEAMASKVKLEEGFTDEMRKVFRDIAQVSDIKKRKKIRELSIIRYLLPLYRKLRKEGRSKLGYTSAKEDWIS